MNGVNICDGDSGGPLTFEVKGRQEETESLHSNSKKANPENFFFVKLRAFAAEVFQQFRFECLASLEKLQHNFHPSKFSQTVSKDTFGESTRYIQMHLKDDICAKSRSFSFYQARADRHRLLRGLRMRGRRIPERLRLASQRALSQARRRFPTF